MSLKIIEMFIPKSYKFTRPGRKMNPESITIHETDNTNVRANASAHARLQVNGNRRQASWHLQTDDEPEIYQSLPFSEISYHAGNRKGNNTSISIEMCVNRDGNYKKTVANTIQLVRWLLKKYPSIKAVNVVQHNYWSGKKCPRYLRSGIKGIDWNAFIKGVRKGKAKVTKPSKAPAYVTTNVNFNVGDKVKLKSSAKRYATGERIPKRLKNKTYTIQQRGSNRMLLKELYSWVKTSDLKPVGGSSSKPTKKKASIEVGNKVTLSKSATKYATGERIPSSIKGKRYTIQQVKSDRVLLKEIYSWMYKKDIGGSASTKAKSKTLRVGSKVKIKSSAKKYSRANVTIPNRFKNKTYTIQQVSKNDVLIKELYSWVRKSDLT